MRQFLRFLSHKRNWLGPLLLVIMLGMAIATPKLVPNEDPSQPQTFLRVGLATDSIPHPPNGKALLGTLSGQYDVLFTLLWGLRQAFTFGLSITSITAVFGILYGAASAYMGGAANNVMMRISDAFLAFPVLAAIVFMKQIVKALLVESGSFIFGIGTSGLIPETLTSMQQNLLNVDPVMWSLILFSWMPYARLVNASVLRLRKIDYVLSARALGAGHLRIILRHLLPNVISPEIVLAARDIGGMVILQATFTFIGLGGDSPWGRFLAMGRDWIIGPGGNPFVYWWTYLPVTLTLILFSMSWNFIGDSLNDWFIKRRTV